MVLPSGVLGEELRGALHVLEGALVPTRALFKESKCAKIFFIILHYFTFKRIIYKYIIIFIVGKMNPYPLFMTDDFMILYKPPYWIVDTVSSEERNPESSIALCV